jgi:acyl carrier protein
LRERMRTQGFGTIGPAEGFAVLDRLLLQNETQACVLPVSWNGYLRYYYGGEAPPFFAAVAEENTVRGDGGGRRSPVLEKLAGAPESRRRAILRDYVGNQVAVVLGERAADGIRPRQRLFDLGIDSLMAVELKNRLQSGMTIPLGATLVFDHPTVEVLADYLLERWSVLNGTVRSSGEKRNGKRLDAAMATGELIRGEGRNIAASPGETNLDEASPEDVARMLAKELGAGNEN